MPYLPAFREDLRRVVSDMSHGMRPSPETHALLGAGNLARGNFMKRLFWDQDDTPGLNSDKAVTRWVASGWHVLKLTILCSPVNPLLVCVPLGIIAAKADWGAGWVFGLNMAAIIPLAAILSFATEEIAVPLGQALGGLLNATFGNAVELIVSIIALRNGQIEVVQSSMLGSILSNILLVTGMCFAIGGWRNRYDSNGHGRQQEFAMGTAQTSCSLMAMSSATLIIPATLYAVLDRTDKEAKDNSILILSRGTAIVLLLLYVVYLYFQLISHYNLFTTKKPKPRPDRAPLNPSNGRAYGTTSASGTQPDVEAPLAEEVEEEEEDEETAHISVWAAGIVLVAVTVIISFCADYLVDSIDDIVATGAISKNFIGLILIPIVGNAAEHVTACFVAYKDKMDLALSVSLGSSIQIALLVTPFLVILGWAALDQPMTLRFETFETVAFMVSMLVVVFTVQDGNSNYLEGAMLIGLYFIIALAFYASPTESLDKTMMGFFP